MKVARSVLDLGGAGDGSGQSGKQAKMAWEEKTEVKVGT